MCLQLNEKPIRVDRIEDEHEEKNDFKPSFWFENKRWFLEDFIGRYTPWTHNYDDLPDYIHGIEADNYVNPLLIELVKEGEAVNVYRERTETNKYQYI